MTTLNGHTVCASSSAKDRRGGRAVLSSETDALIAIINAAAMQCTRGSDKVLGPPEANLHSILENFRLVRVTQ